MKRQTSWSSIILWVFYLALLAVLLPHTAWAFARFEPPSSGWLGISWGQVTAWAAAFAFEAAIAALTHRLAQRIEITPNYTGGRVLLRRLSYQYLNAYAGGLLVALGVSALANFAHAVEYGQDFAIFSSYQVPPLLYSVTFGGILPLVSLLFARILGDTTDAEDQPDPKLIRAKQVIGELEAGLEMAEQRFAAAGDLFA
jgi:hypothetical protein